MTQPGPWHRMMVEIRRFDGDKISPVPGWISADAPGLSVTPVVRADGTTTQGEWIVTHTRSGCSVTGGRSWSVPEGGRDAAREAAIAMSAIFPFAQFATKRRAIQAMNNETYAKLQQLWPGGVEV